MKLIVIEDDPGFAHLIKETLTGFAESISVFDNWGIANFEDCEVAWIDLRMPDSGERETVDRVKRLRAHNKDIIIIIGSGHITPELRDELDHLGIDGWYYKSANFTAGQMASLVILSIMKGVKRTSGLHKKLLQAGLEWLGKRFPAEELSAALPDGMLLSVDHHHLPA